MRWEKGMGREIPAEMTLLELAQEVQKKGEPLIVAARVDNVLRDLQTPVGDFHTIELVDTRSEFGRRIYRRSVVFLLIMAVRELYSETEVVVQFTAHKGLYCAIQSPFDVTESVVLELEQRMREIVAENRPIVKKRLQREEVVQLFKKSEQIEKANLVMSLETEKASLYYCGEFYDYLFGPMVSATGVLDKFALDAMPGGVLLRTPEPSAPEIVPAFKEQPKFGSILMEAERWASVLHCDYVSDLNRYIRRGEVADIIHVSEALHEKKIAEIADHIASNIKELRLILIAGPSSSGKTSFAQRLRIQLRVNGIEPVSISLDDYFRNWEDTPRTKDGAYDFENIGALDVELFNDHLVRLLNGEEVILPHYNFLTGKREVGSEHLSIAPTSPLIVEGIHGLNEALTASVPRGKKFKIYISALTQLNIDAHNRIPTTDARLLRRMVRDYQFRGAYALKTLRQWPDVRAGEEKNIFPFQEEADAMFNSALIYELAVLKRYAVPLLEMVPRDVPEYTKANRLLDFCRCFSDITEEYDIPNNSLLREFIGKSIFFK
ncbi:MAG: nucleoside kinase [Selenomonas sp.]|uniref:nucleoside kinase n=1 Tax=Selenomonas TaxID=970 RepID=UPI00027C3FE6|nr:MULTISPECIES: nucleoside kinase [Selenomonas]EJU28093.1 phosphoribulokinase/Uridine kinase family protein [Selenomonas sp. CM52]UZE46110.1 nucleoside kinase [Selenomonas sputigena]